MADPRERLLPLLIAEHDAQELLTNARAWGETPEVKRLRRVLEEAHTRAHAELTAYRNGLDSTPLIERTDLI